MNAPVEVSTWVKVSTLNFSLFNTVSMSVRGTVPPMGAFNCFTDAPYV